MNAEKVLWVQEEPENMGAWSYVLRTLRSLNPACVSRPESASPASGSYKMHQQQQQNLLNEVSEFCKTK
jgi:2-oxoglutarate dehydrogenase E1 component